MMTEISLQCTPKSSEGSETMKKNIRLTGALIVLSGLLAACASSTDPADAYKNETPQQIFDRGKAAMRDGSYSEAAKRFEALDVQYPFGAETEQAQLFLIYAYYQKEEFPMAVAAADHFIRLHPTNPNVDYAYYMRGISNYYQNIGVIERLFAVDLATRDLAQIQTAYGDFDTVVTRFPNSRYAPPAHQYMIYLRNVLADHELHVAEYYYDRKAYVAAANRASALVAHYQGAPTVEDGLILMAKSYHKLGETKLESDTLRVLNYNYPGVRIDYDSYYRVNAGGMT